MMTDTYLNENILFTPFAGIGKISFMSEEKDIISALGEPEHREIYYYNSPSETNGEQFVPTEPIQYSVNLYYSNIAVFIGYQDERFQGTSVHLDDLILDGQRFSEVYKEDVLDLLENYHNKNKLRFICQTSYTESTNEECYEYDNIGLTIWYAGNDITNICVMTPNAWEM